MIFKLCSSEVSVCIQMIGMRATVEMHVWRSRRFSLFSYSNRLPSYTQPAWRANTVLSDVRYLSALIACRARRGHQFVVTVDVENMLFLTIFGLQNWFSHSN